MPRPVREPNQRLQTLIDEAGFSHQGLARRINDLGRTRGIAGLAYDHSSVIRWLKGELPRDPVPALIAEVFSMTLARRITPGDLGIPASRTLPDLGLRFAPSLRDTVEIITALWSRAIPRSLVVTASYVR